LKIERPWNDDVPGNEKQVGIEPISKRWIGWGNSIFRGAAASRIVTSTEESCSSCLELC